MNMPILEVKIRQRGHWIECVNFFRCDMCGWETGAYQEKTNFCPHCGADMRPDDEVRLAYVLVDNFYDDFDEEE